MRRGIVRRVEGDRATVEIGPAAECGECELCGGATADTIEVSLEDGTIIAPGACVTVEPPEGIFFRVGALFYLLPLLAFTLGILGGMELARRLAPVSWPVEALGALGGLLALLLVIPLIRRAARPLLREFARSRLTPID